MSVLENVLVARAEGRLDDDDLEKVASLHDLLYTKVGDAGAQAVGSTILDVIKKSVTDHVAPLVLGTLAVQGAVAGGAALADKMTKKRDLNRILQVFPRLQEDHTPAQIQLAYNSIRHMNPHIAKDPLAGGTLLRQVLETRDPLDPSGGFRHDATLALSLMRERPRANTAAQDALHRAVQTGLSTGIDDALRTRQLETQRAFQAQFEKDKFQRETGEQRARDALLREERRKSSALEQKRKAELARAQAGWTRDNQMNLHEEKRKDVPAEREWMLRLKEYESRLGKAEADPVFDPLQGIHRAPMISDALHHRPPLP